MWKPWDGGIYLMAPTTDVQQGEYGLVDVEYLDQLPHEYFKQRPGRACLAMEVGVPGSHFHCFRYKTDRVDSSVSVPLVRGCAFVSCRRLRDCCKPWYHHLQLVGTHMPEWTLWDVVESLPPMATQLFEYCH
eukprot:COSAG06_NODE_1910_length_8082_cov_19.909558_2_plen_132_part_00